MSSQKFSSIQRKAIWEGHGMKCAYCGNIIERIYDMEIDHIIPKYYMNKSTELAVLLLDYELRSDFDLQSYENLLPTHHSCNQRKNTITFQKATALFYLEIARKQKEKIFEIENRIRKDIEKSNVLSLLEVSMDDGDILASDVKHLLNREKATNLKISISEELEFVERSYSKWIKQNETEELLDLTVKFSNHPDDFLDLINDNNDRLEIRSCRDWKQAIRNGYYPENNVGIKVGSIFAKYSDTIDAISKAKLASTSYINNPQVGINSIELLPLEILPIFDEYYHVEKEKGTTFKNLVENKKVLIKATSENSIEFEYYYLNCFLKEILRADLDNDGNEDIFVYGYNSAIGGTLGYGYTLKLSRNSEDSLFSIIVN